MEPYRDLAVGHVWGKETRSATPTWPLASRPPRHQTAQVLWSIRYGLLCWLLRLLVRCGLDELDLETVVLHYQLKVLQRGGRRVLFTTANRAFLAAAARVLSRHRWKSFLVGPDTLARWHRDLLSRGAGRGSRPPGRPPLDPSIRHLVLRLGRENPRWGYLRIRGELLKLAIDVSGTTIATVLREGGLGPAPRRIGPTWTQFLRLQAYGLLSPGAPPEKQGLQDLRSGPEGLSEAGTNETDEPIDVDPGAPKSAAVHPRPRALLRTASPREGPRARDGPAIAA